MSTYFSEAKLDEDKSKRLIVACANAKRDEVESLLENDAFVKAINDKNNQGETAAHVAATGGDHVICQMLLDNGADNKVCDKSGATPLMRATAMGNYDAVQVFLGDDEESLFYKGSNGQTAMHSACLISHQDLIEHFIELDDEDNPKLLAAKDNDGNSAWHSAASPPLKTEVLQTLLDHKADLNEQNNAGETALLLASKAENIKGMKFLLEKGADCNLASKEGSTPLHEAAFRKNEDAVKLLLENKANVHAEKASGEEPLALGCAGGSAPVVNLLIGKGCDVNKYCLHSAVKYERAGIVPLLLNKGADINALDKQGRAPLIIAIENNSPEMVKLLCENKASIAIKYKSEATNGKAVTPIQFAKLQNCKDCQKILEEVKKGCIIS